jgi:hypothetical protein
LIIFIKEEEEIEELYQSPHILKVLEENLSYSSLWGMKIKPTLQLIFKRDRKLNSQFGYLK